MNSDLVPLVHISQLFTNKMNYIQIRKGFKRFGVVEKPVLMKKKSKPTIGITQLSNKVMSNYSRVTKLPSNWSSLLTYYIIKHGILSQLQEDRYWLKEPEYILTSQF